MDNFTELLDGWLYSSHFSLKDLLVIILMALKVSTRLEFVLSSVFKRIK